MTRTKLESALAIILVLGILFHAAVRNIFSLIGVYQTDWIAAVLIETLLAFLCAVWIVGWKAASSGLVAIFAASWLIEQLGVTTGLLFGPYHYTDKLGVKLLDVPVVVPLAWFMIVFISQAMANYIVDHDVESAPAGLRHTVLLSLVGAFVAVGYDMCTDPIMVNQVGGWVWVGGGPYFGVPLSNFAGWLAAAFVLSFLFRWISLRVSRPAFVPGWKWIGAYPFLAYATFALGYAMIGNPPATRVIGLFGMGGLVVLTIPGFMAYLKRPAAQLIAQATAPTAGGT